MTKYLHPNVETGKIKFVCDDATNKKFRFSSFNSNIKAVLGFNDVEETDIFTTTINSSTVCNLNKNNVVYLVWDLCVHENKDRA